MPADVDPRVSVVVVVHGQLATARATLSSLAATVDVAAEVLVVDNASPGDAGRRLVDEFPRARVLLSRTNLGFGTGVDLGAQHARGEFIAVMNSDVVGKTGWLSALVAALDDDRTAGAAVPLYLSADGSVQDAGGMVGRDGRGYAYGAPRPPDHPELAFRRAVDYGSAAALLVRREAFDAVGGFDPAYGLGYFEDADLGFSLRAAGWDTIYVPTARVTHLGGATFGPAARLALSEANRPTFVARFAEALQGRPLLGRPPYDPHRDLVVRDWLAPQRLLLIDPRGQAGAMAGAVQRRWPRARVTWLPGPGGALAADDRIEVLPGLAAGGPPDALARWLEARRFHYGAVAHVGPTEVGALDRSQPGAHRVAVERGDAPETLVDVLARRGFGP